MDRNYVGPDALVRAGERSSPGFRVRPGKNQRSFAPPGG